MLMFFYKIISGEKKLPAEEVLSRPSFVTKVRLRSKPNAGDVFGVFI